jgi:hypothetical protein
MLGALIHCWVQLAGVSGGEKTYLGSSIIIKIYPALSLAIGGQDGMDGGALLCNLFGYWWAGQDGLQRGTLDEMSYK